MLREVGGLVLLAAPGVAWTWALFPRLDWARATLVAVVLALTLQPALFYALNRLFGLRLGLGVLVVLCAFVTAAGIASGVLLRRGQPRTSP